MAETSAEKAGQPSPVDWKRGTALDVLFVVVLPLLAMLLDPGIIARGPLAPEALRETVGGPGLFYQFQLPLHFLILLLITLFWMSWLPGFSQWQNALFRGSLIFGAILGGLFAILLIPLSLFALREAPYLVPFAILPLATAWRFVLRARAMPRWKYGFSHVVAGLVTPPLLSAALFHAAEQTLEPMFQQLRSTEPDIGLAALKELTSHPLCQSGCRGRILFMHCRGDAPFPADKMPTLLSGDFGDIIRTDMDCAFTW